jgi:hypothetical protein
MKPTVIVPLILIVIFISVLPSFSQLPYLQPYFDSRLRPNYDTITECPPDPPGTVLDTMYIVAHGLDAFINAIEYKMDYTDKVLWLYDDTGGLNIGNTNEGIATAWPLPLNAYSPVVVAKVLFLWNCQLCNDCTNTCICPQGHPANGSVRAVRWPDNQLIYMTVEPGRICPYA